MLYLVSCSAIKGQTPAAACDLYSSDLFRKTVAYLQKLNAEWRVLSATHGLLHPTAIVAPYDRHLATLSQSERLAWAHTVVASLPEDEYTVFAGRVYTAPLANAGLLFHDPLAGLEVGDRKAWFSRELRLLNGSSW